MVISLFFPTFVVNPNFLKEFFKYLFHETTPIPTIVGEDHLTMALNFIGDASIFLFFLGCSLICIFAGKTLTPKEAYKQRIIAINMLAASFMSCSISRGLNVLAIWHNYYFLNGLFKNITGSIALCLFLYTPFLIKAIKTSRELEKVKNTMEETSKKVEELKIISQKVIEKDS